MDRDSECDEGKMTGKDQYDSVCKQEFKDINSKLDRIIKGLYMDNGGECIQSKINRHDRWIRNVMLVIGGAWAVLIGIIIKWLS